MDYVRAFVVGGIICGLVQILLDKTKMMPGRVMVTLVVLGSILGCLGLYEPFAKWAGAGATVPLLIRKHPVEWGEGGNSVRRVPGRIQGRPYSQRGGNLRGAGIRIPGSSGF